LLDINVFRRGGIAIEPDFKRSRFVLVHRRGNEQAVAPDDRAGMAQAGNGRFPEDVFRGLDVPSCRRFIGWGESAGEGPAKRGPIGFSIN
jgi:hypothetical protein